MKILLIRHGKTLANEKKLYCGSTDLSLTPDGCQALLEKQYTPPDNCRYLSSGMRRADETLELLFGNVPFQRIPELREVDFGRFEMHSYEELKQDEDYLQWISGDNIRNVPPGGESGEQMTRRVTEAFSAIAQEGHNTVIVTHGGVIAAIMAWLFPEEQKNRYQWQCANGDGYLLSFENGVWQYQHLR